MKSEINSFFLYDTGKKIIGRYTCRALFPGAVSSIHPDSMMLIILNQFVKNDTRPDVDQNVYVSEKIINDFSANTEVQGDKNKGRLLNDWITKDLCFRTKHGLRGPYIKPLCINVPALYPWYKGDQEPYGKIVAELLRVGRKEASLNVDDPMLALKKCFEAGFNDPENSILKSCFPEPREREDWKITNEDKYKTDHTLCYSQARLFQSDIQHILCWVIPRNIRLRLVQRLMLFHFCTYYVKMAFLLDDLVKKAKRFIRLPMVSKNVFFCENCCKQSNFDDKYIWENCCKCQYHPKYPIDESERSQVWHNVLIKYQENVGTLKFIMHKVGVSLKNLNNKDNILSLLDNLYRKRSELSVLEPLLNDLEIFNLENPPTSQAWVFFKRYAYTQRETSFITKPLRGIFGIKISPELLSVFVHCFIQQQKTDQKPPLFSEFLLYLNARGFDSVGTNATELENKLRSLGVLKDYEDMGAARVLEPIYIHKENI